MIVVDVFFFSSNFYLHTGVVFEKGCVVYCSKVFQSKTENCLVKCDGPRHMDAVNFFEPLCDGMAFQLMRFIFNKRCDAE